MTPTVGSNLSRYPIPDDLDPSGFCCVSIPVPDDPQWRAMLLGAIWRLSLQTHWERDAAKSAKTVAARWREVWREVSEMTCCSERPIDIAIQNTVLNTQISIYMQTIRQMWIDNSENVQLAFYQVPDNFDSDAGDAGPDIALRDAALCIAATSYVAELFNRGMRLLLGQTEEALAIGAAAIQLSAPLPVIGQIIVVGGIILVGVSGVTVYQQLANAEYRNYIACGIYEALRGSATSSFEDFEQALDNLPSRPPPPQTTPENIARDAIETWARSQINNIDNYLSFVRNLNAAMDYAQSTGGGCACSQVTLELGELSAFPVILEPELEDRGGGVWRLTGGIWTRESPFFNTDVILVQRVGGGCFDVDIATMISGDISRTSWTNCDDSGGQADTGVPQQRQDIKVYALQDVGDEDGFVVDITVSLPD